MLSERKLTVAVEVSDAAGVSQPLDLKTAWVVFKDEVGIAVAALFLEREASSLYAALHPVLEVVFLVLLVGSNDWDIVVEAVRQREEDPQLRGEQFKLMLWNPEEHFKPS